jgi:hypothetical protein
MISNMALTPSSVKNQKALPGAVAIPIAQMAQATTGRSTHGILGRGAIQFPRYDMASMPLPEYTRAFAVPPVPVCVWPEPCMLAC